MAEAMCRRLSSVVVFAVLTTLSIDVSAQGGEATAEALFLEGRRLMEQKQWSAAAEKMRASDRVEPSVGARISLGDCLAELDKTASAWGVYRSAANLARQRGDSKRAKIADDRAEAMGPRLTFAIIEVPDPVEGLEIAFDGEVRPRALWGQRFPIDPGSHTITARADGHETWTQTLSSGDPGAEVAVEVPALKAIEKPPVEPEPPVGPEPQRPEQPPESTWTTGRKAAIGVAAAGVVGVVAGSVFGLSARSKWNDAKANNCNEQLACDAEGVALVDDARSAGNISTVAFAVGGAAIAGAAVLWFVTAPAPADAEVVGLSPVIGPDGAGLAISGTF